MRGHRVVAHSAKSTASFFVDKPLANKARHLGFFACQRIDGMWLDQLFGG